MFETAQNNLSKTKNEKFIFTKKGLGFDFLPLSFFSYF
jgi:hypothetical protein